MNKKEKEKTIFEIKKDFISETMTFERMSYFAAVGFIIGFLTKSVFDKTINIQGFLIIILLLIFVLVVSEKFIEKYRERKYNELKEEVEKGNLNRTIKMKVYKNKK